MRYIVLVLIILSTTSCNTSSLDFGATDRTEIRARSAIEIAIAERDARIAEAEQNRYARDSEAKSEQNQQYYKSLSNTRISRQWGIAIVLIGSLIFLAVMGRSIIQLFDNIIVQWISYRRAVMMELIGLESDRMKLNALRQNILDDYLEEINPRTADHISWPDFYEMARPNNVYAVHGYDDETGTWVGAAVIGSQPVVYQLPGPAPEQPIGH